MMTKQQRIDILNMEIENLQEQMQNELVELYNKKSVFLNDKKKAIKEEKIIDFYSNEIAKKQVDIDELSEE